MNKEQFKELTAGMSHKLIGELLGKSESTIDSYCGGKRPITPLVAINAQTLFNIHQQIKENNPSGSKQKITVKF